MQALIPNAERGALLAITDGERDLWSCAAPGTKPYIASFGASVNENRLAVAWNVEAEDKATEVWLQWSADRGRAWNALATGLSGDAGEFDASHLPAGAVTLRLNKRRFRHWDLGARVCPSATAFAGRGRASVRMKAKSWRRAVF